MIDLQPLLIMLGGTLLAALLQAGWSNFRITAAAVRGLARPAFDPAQTKAELSRQISDLERDGLVRAPRAVIADTEFGKTTSAMIAARSLDALLAEHEANRAVRFDNSATARQVCMSAAELAQMFGLAGTLLSLGRLGPLTDGAGGVASAIGLAVTTTLYGVILANILFVPLAGMIERRARAEDRAREDLFGWLESHALKSAPKLAEFGVRDDGHGDSSRGDGGLRDFRAA